MGKKATKGGARRGRRDSFSLDDPALLTIRLPNVSTELSALVVEGSLVAADEPPPTAPTRKARRNTLAQATAAMPVARPAEPGATGEFSATSGRPTARPDAPTVKVPKPKRLRATALGALEADSPAEVAARRGTAPPAAPDDALLAITARRTTQLPAVEAAAPPAAHATTQLPAVRATTQTPAVRPITSAPSLSAASGRRAAPLVIPGSGRAYRLNYVRRRKRPLVMRMAVLVASACIVLAGLFAVLPITSGAADAARHTGAFQAIANAVLWRGSPDYRWYTVRNGDTLDSLSSKFHVQIGGIYELNGMLSGEELQVGKAYKIPTDPNYGLYYRPQSYQASFSGTNTSGTGYYGPTIYTDQIWSTMAGMPPEGALCGPTPRGSGDNLASYDPASFDLKAPNWGAYWVRGFTWYHFGVDLANPEGTPIHAAQSGEVVFAAWDTGGGGWSVKINHCNHLSSAYGHMDQLLVKVHQMVRVGDVIGLEGSTGWSTGPHLHFSTQWDNTAVDPMQFFTWSQYNITHPLPDV
ncbi:MAG TPA: peptidoglycan DD-metalloendopeptidase family protein [Ktedonobacterales bacterium]